MCDHKSRHKGRGFIVLSYVTCGIAEVKHEHRYGKQTGFEHHNTPALWRPYMMSRLPPNVKISYANSEEYHFAALEGEASI